MKKYDRLIKKFNISKETKLYIPVFSEDAFVKCNIGNKNDFYDLECVEDTAYNYLTNLQETTLEKIIFGVIDEQYFIYLTNNNLVDTKQERENYIKNLSNERRSELWKKYEYNYGYDWGIIPIIIENDTYKNLLKGKEPEDIKYNFVINELQKQQIKKSIWTSFNNYNDNDIKYNIKEKDVYISPYLIPLVQLNDNDLIDELFDDGINEFNKKLNKINKAKTIQIIPKEKSLDFFGIFIMYRYQVPYEIDNNYIEIAKQTTVTTPDLNMEELEEILSSSINVTFDILTSNLIYSESINNVIGEFIELLVQQIDKKTNALTAMNDSIAGHCKKKDKKKKKK